MSDAGNRTSTTLLAGVVVSFVFLTCALAFDMISTGRTANIAPDQVRRVLADALHGDPAALAHIGILVLLATPFARVVVLVTEFIRARDRAFTAISIGVLLMLGLSIAIGLL